MIQNMEAEWTDVVLFESVSQKVSIYEHDTTRETPDETAAWIDLVVGGRVAPAHGKIDWLGESPPESLALKPITPKRGRPRS